MASRNKVVRVVQPPSEGRSAPRLSPLESGESREIPRATGEDAALIGDTRHPLVSQPLTRRGGFRGTEILTDANAGAAMHPYKRETLVEPRFRREGGFGPDSNSNNTDGGEYGS